MKSSYIVERLLAVLLIVKVFYSLRSTLLGRGRVYHEDSPLYIGSHHARNGS